MSLASGYSYSQLKPFIDTLYSSGYTGKFILFVSNITKEALNSLERRGITLIHYSDNYPYLPNNPEIPSNIVDQSKEVLSPNSLRYILYYLYLKNAGSEQIDRIMFSDIRDVIFQKNPFDYNYKPGLYCFLEDADTKIKDEKHNSFWIQHGFGPEELSKIGHNTICCSGVTIGDYVSIIDYLEKMINHIIKLKNVGGLDQGIHNYLIYNNKLDSLNLINDDEGPITTLSYFKNFNKVLFHNGSIINKSGQPVNIVHQYDRNLSLLRKYYFKGYINQLINISKRNVLEIRLFARIWNSIRS